MDVNMKILCKDFEQVKIVQNKISVSEQSEEYYIILLNKSFDMTYDDEVFLLSFNNQLLLLKYSNYWREILIKDYNFTECVLIKSSDILDIHVTITNCTDYIRKNVWQHNTPSFNKKYINTSMLILPVLDDTSLYIKEFNITNIQISLFTNEVLLKTVKSRSEHNGYIVIPNNIVLCNEAIFIPLTSNDIKLFLE